MEVITGRRQRRNWSDEEKARIIAESAEPEANISEVARRNGVSRGLLTVWRRLARVSSVGTEPFARVQIEASADNETRMTCSSVSVETDGRIEIRIVDATVYVPGGVDAQTLKSVIAALRPVR